MAEDAKLPKRHHVRTKSITSDLTNDGKESTTRPRLPRTQSRKKFESLASNEATVAFVRRTLCGHQIRSGAASDGLKGGALPPPLEELLPPLTSSNEIDLQLYALIAIIIKDFVQTWYSKITPDQHFTDEVIHIIAHCTRALEQRLRHVDLEALILDELPALIDFHVSAYRTACGVYTSPLGTDPRRIYHAIHPHPALSPTPLELEPSLALEQAENEVVWRQLLIQAALSRLLPPEDLENPCLKALVTDILSELIVGNAICGKICEGWFIWETVTKLIELSCPSVAQDKYEKPAPTTSRLEQFGLLSDDKSGDANSAHDTTSSSEGIIFSIFWQFLRYSTMLFLGIRAFIISFSDAASLPARAFSTDDNSSHSKHHFLNGAKTDGLLEEDLPPQFVDRPILGMSAWSCCSRLLSIDLRMPWLTAICGFLQWLLIYGPGKLGCTNSRLDRMISRHVSLSILNPDRLPSILLIIRMNLFPNNTLGQGRVPPTMEEIVEIKRLCASAIIEAIPEFLRSKIFAAQDSAAIQSEVEEMLEAFGDPYMNKHLMFAIVDLIFTRIVPEIREHSISTLLND